MVVMEDNRKDSINIKRIIWIVGIVILLLWGGSWLALYLFYDLPTDRGTFGDMFGAVNALFSGLAFAGLIVTLLYQKEELQLQREELAQTREELKGQKEEFKEQNETLKRQRFENTFFNMLTLHQEIVKSFEFTDIATKRHHTSNGWSENAIPKNYSGREYFKFSFERKRCDCNGHFYNGLRGVLDNVGINGYDDSETVTELDHYFRNLYRIIKFIDESTLISDFQDRYQYTSMVRGQLSPYELLWLFYDGLSTYGREKFQPLIEKYALLKNIRVELLVKKEDKDLYASSAYRFEY